jgi:hypothetical protein
VTDRDRIIDLLPLLAQDKLEGAQKDSVLKEVAAHPDLQRELEFWQGLHQIRRDMPLYDAGEHLSPELLDRLARDQISRLSPEYSQISAHLQSCSSCTEDLELLREAVRLAPEDQLVPGTASTNRGWLRGFLRLIEPARPAFAAVLPLVLLVIVVFSAFGPFGNRNDTLSILLQPQFEKRNFTGEAAPHEYEFHMPASIDRVAFQFSTDRLDLPSYGYSISLTPAGSQPIQLGSETIDCFQTEMSNRCAVTISDPKLVSLLRKGGSFAISIKEELPANSGLEPADYEYYFRVLPNN